LRKSLSGFFVAKNGVRTMKRGAKKTPTTLKVLNGNPGKRTIPEDEVKPKPLMPKKPSFLKGEAAKEWRRIAPKLEALGLLTEIDGSALADYCVSYAHWVECEIFLQQFSHDKDGKFNGAMFKTPTGYMQQLPQVSMSLRYQKEMRDALSKFGMSPSDRAGLVTPKAPEKAGKLSRTLSG
jgi:P27 family predicted phage terminase small subunit